MCGVGKVGGCASRERPDARMSEDGEHVVCVDRARVDRVAARGSGPLEWLSSGPVVTAQHVWSSTGPVGSVVPGRASYIIIYLVCQTPAESSHV